MIQCSIFDRLKSKTITDNVVNKSYRNANESWKDLAYKAVETVCLQQKEFTSDDVAKVLQEWEKKTGITTHSKRALGGVFRRAANDGLCSCTDRIKNSIRLNMHGQRLSVWVSNLV